MHIPWFSNKKKINNKLRLNKGSRDGRVEHIHSVKRFD